MPGRPPGPTRIGALVLALLAGAACTAVDGRTTSSSDRSPGPAEACVNEDVDQAERHTVASVDTAAWLVEDLLPPPLRTAGLHSDETTILLEGEAVGEVTVEETEPGIFVATGFTFCVPVDVELASIDLVETLGGSWRLSKSVPELDLPEHAEITLIIREGYFGGWAACNEYSAEPAVGQDGEFRLSQVSFTEAECADDERVYWGWLQTVDRWALEDGQLELSGPGVALRYVSTDGR